MNSGFVRGDRVPDFRRPNPAGEQIMLYDLQCGFPVVLLVLPRPDDAAGTEVLAAMREQAARWEPFTRVALVRGAPRDFTRLTTTIPTGVTLLGDDDAVASVLFGDKLAAQTSVAAFALDPNMRVMERLERAPQEAAAAFLDRVLDVYAREPRVEPRVKTQQAPVLFVPHVFEIEMCNELIAYFGKEGGKPSGTGVVEGSQVYWKLDPAVKMRSDVYLQEPALLERVKERLVRRLLPEIQRCFNFQVTQHEVFKLSCYDAETGGYFRPHRDNESADTRHRRFAMTLNLNTGDYDGGQLHLPEFGPDLYQPGRGDAVVFSSSLLHEVVPVTRGKRYVLIGFFFGKDQSMAPMNYVPAASGA